MPLQPLNIFLSKHSSLLQAVAASIFSVHGRRNLQRWCIWVFEVAFFPPPLLSSSIFSFDLRSSSVCWSLNSDLVFLSCFGVDRFRPFVVSIPELRPAPGAKQVDFFSSLSGASSVTEFTPKYPSMAIKRHGIRSNWKPASGVSEDRNASPKFATQEAENFLLDAINMSFFERLNLAWKIVFPSAVSKKSSNARIAKQRLKMILFSDRCEVSDEAKRKIVSNNVQSLSDFVEIESQDKVQLSVSADTDLGTIYSVTVPVRRVKAEYQDMDDEYGTITNIEYKDVGDSSGSVDVRFDFYVPDERS